MQGNSTVIPLLFNVVSAKFETFTVSWDELFYSLLVDIHVLLDQPSFHCCFHGIEIYGLQEAMEKISISITFHFIDPLSHNGAPDVKHVTYYIS
jgi:hypothetical protein